MADPIPGIRMLFVNFVKVIINLFLIYGEARNAHPDLNLGFSCPVGI